MASSVEEQYLCNYDFEISQYDCDVANKLWNHKWVPEREEIIQRILKTEVFEESLTEVIKTILNNETDKRDLLHLAIGSFLSFCEQNWCNPETRDHKLYALWPENVNAFVDLQLDSVEVVTNTFNPELLLLSMQIFKVLFKVDESLLHLWWYFRCKVIHQRILEDTSASLYKELEGLIVKLKNECESLTIKPRLQALLYVEIGEAYLLYGRAQEAEKYIDDLENLIGFKMSLVGLLGKRTMFQQTVLPQLSLKTELTECMERPPAALTHGSTVLPSLVALEDDVRLDHIQYAEEVKSNELPSLEQAICLFYVQYLNKCRPSDELKNEELLPFLDGVLSQKHGAWSTRVATILMKCKLESTHKRSVERALKQCEAIVKSKHVGDSVYRLSYLWASGLQPSWRWERQLADLCLSLGLIKAALEIYLKLQLWEDVIVCYTILDMRHKAAEIIQQQIDIKPTPKLYCLLGDATDNIEWYEKAWEFSGFKSSRAQKHWGNYLFNHKEYKECIQHYQKSLEINSLQEHVWLRLGFAALNVEDWTIAGMAYRRYTYLEPKSFEAWNNLAKAYVKQGDKNRAYKALKEAIKHNYDNWKLWENVITVSMDTGHFIDVVIGCHRLLDLRGKFDDYEIMTLLVRAVVEEREDADGNCKTSLKQEVTKLLARTCSIHQNQPEVWLLYADITSEYILKAQRLLSAYRGFKDKLNSPKTPDIYSKIVNVTIALIKCAKQARQEVNDVLKSSVDSILSSARLAGQATLSAAAKQEWPVSQTELQELRTNFEDITDYIKSFA